MENNIFDLHEFSEKTLLVEALCKRVVENLKEAIQEKGYATLALSGGSTPKKMLQELSSHRLEWEKVRVTLVDERWVDASSDDSNEKLIRDNLFINNAKIAQFYPLKIDMQKAVDSIDSLEMTLKEFSSSLDVVILGMGLDAHTASFFPDSNSLAHALDTSDLVCSTFAPIEPKERITLSRSYLLGTKNLLLHIEGEEKKKVFDEATKFDDESKMPIISMMKQKEPILEVYYAS